MPADDRLILFLRALQTYSDQQDNNQLLSTASYLLVTLTNPLNVTVVTAQLLAAPAIWAQANGLQTCHRFLGAFQSAALTVKRHNEKKSNSTEAPLAAARQYQQPDSGNISRDVWIQSVLSGLDDRSPRWRHLLVLAGVLLSYEEGDLNSLFGGVRTTVSKVFVEVLNLSLVEVRAGDDLEASCVAMALNYVFPILMDISRSKINYDLLLPVLMRSSFFSQEGYRSGYFITNIDTDVVPVLGDKFSWSDKSRSYVQLATMSSQPLVNGMGPLARLIAHTVENCKDPWLIQAVMEDISTFSQTLMAQWRRNKVSEVDVSEEKVFFNDSTLHVTLPILWKMLQSCLFTIVVVLRGCLDRVLGDHILSSDEVAPVLASQTLTILRHLYFIASRLGAKSFTQYTYVYLTAIDILCAYPQHAGDFLREIVPAATGQIPAYPLDRILSLYYLNTAEHFALVLPPQANDELLVASALPYLDSGMDSRLTDMFEAAHSVMLSVLSAPLSIDLARLYLPRYTDALFSAFPKNLSSRQFRMAFKTLLRITTPPSPLAAFHAEYPEILLELVRHRAETSAANPTLSLVPPDHGADGETTDEGTTLVLTLIDSLCLLPISLLEEYLPLTVDSITVLKSSRSRAQCKQGFWEALSSGEMDMDRSQICLAWWTTYDGRDRVMTAGDEHLHDSRFLMSGALQEVEREQKL